MVSVSEVFKAWNEGFEKKDSSQLAELFTDDFRFVSTIRDIGKQEALDWTAAGGNPTAIDDLEVLYENDEIAVIHHSANQNNNVGVAMAVYTKKDGKISQCRIVRTAV
tara:strand:+ start:114 stop:437 length:324 start_codon:yes stop_codon:yes gene_type:complete